jgi:4,5-dihydroxyphthalate decarboxylase
MVDVPITIACGDYDRTRAIRDGIVRVEGCAVTYLPLHPEEIFHRVFKFQEFDVAEISFSSYIRTVATGASAYIGIPAFVSRIFRHSGIYIRNGAGIRRPQDLRGKRVGLPEYQITAVVWMRALMQHEYGVTPSEIHWRSGGQEQPGRRERTPLKPIEGVDVQPISANKTLVSMLRDGELDALFAARAPSSFLNREPHIARLFPNTRQAEQAYYEKTKLFSDYASRRHPQDARRKLSMAGDQRVQGVLRGQSPSDDRPARRQCADGDAALARSRDKRDHGDYGRGFLEIRRR